MNNDLNILILSKDNGLSTVIQNHVKNEGYDSHVFNNEPEALGGFLSGKFTSCIIDYSSYGNEKEMRSFVSAINNSEIAIPVIFLCEHPTRETIAALFSLHADDVVRTPPDLDILTARIKAIQYRYQPKEHDEIKIYLFGKFRYDIQKQLLSFGDKTTKLTTKESELLTLLCLHANRMLDRIYALQTIWKNENYFSARSMDVYITKLRKLLRDDPTIRIINVHGNGYILSTHEGSE